MAQILTFSRQHNVKLVPLDLSSPVSEALKLIRASTPATIEIVARLTSGTVMADATQIHQVVVNLCSNAIHAMRSRSGRLEISLIRVEVAASLAAELPSDSAATQFLAASALSLPAPVCLSGACISSAARPQTRTPASSRWGG